VERRLGQALIPLLAIALLVPASAVAQDRTIAVNGEVTQQVPNDTAGLGFSVSVERRTRGAALSAVSGRLRAVIAAVQAVPGVGPGDITTGRISVRKGSHGKRVVYRAGEGIAVVLHQPDQAGTLVGAAIRAGATGTRGPNFFVGDSQLAYSRALVAAFDQAKARAVALAAEAGASLGPVVSIEEGGGVSVAPVAGAKGTSGTACASPTPVAKTAQTRCTGPSPPVKPGASTVTATVHVVFAIQ
jgi:uncharacterized protein YggE